MLSACKVKKTKERIQLFFSSFLTLLKSLKSSCIMRMSLFISSICIMRMFLSNN